MWGSLDGDLIYISISFAFVIEYSGVKKHHFLTFPECNVFAAVLKSPFLTCIVFICNHGNGLEWAVCSALTVHGSALRWVEEVSLLLTQLSDWLLQCPGLGVWPQRTVYSLFFLTHTYTHLLMPHTHQNGKLPRALQTHTHSFYNDSRKCAWSAHLLVMIRTVV